MTRAALSGVALGALLICVVTSATPGHGQNTVTHNDKQERGLQRPGPQESRSYTQIVSACEGKGDNPADCRRAARRCAGKRDAAQCLERALEKQAVVTCTSKGIARAPHCTKLARACMGKAGGATVACMWREDARAELAAACEKVGGKPDDCNAIATDNADSLHGYCDSVIDAYDARDCKDNAARHIAFSIGKALSSAPAQQGDDVDVLALMRVHELTQAGKYTEATDVAKRALALAGDKLGPGDLLLAQFRTALASLYNRQGLYTEAALLMNGVLAIVEKASTDLGVAEVLGTLAETYYGQGRTTEAEPLLERALAIAETAPNPYLSNDLNKIAALYRAQGRDTEAELLLKRSLAIAAKVNTPDHLIIGKDLDSLAALYLSQRDWVRATEFWRRATKEFGQGIRDRKESVGHDLGGDTFVRESVTVADDQHLSSMYRALIKAASQLGPPDLNADVRLLREMFQAAQLIAQSKAGESLARMAARSDAGVDPYLIREREALVTEWRERDRDRIAAVQAPETRGRQAEADNITRLVAIHMRIGVIDSLYRYDFRGEGHEFRDYAALAEQEALSVDDVQKELRENEALILFVDTAELPPTAEETFIWIVTKTEVRWVRSELGTSALIREVSALRCGLDYDGAWSIPHSRCPELLNVEYTRADEERHKPLPFDVARAQLYKALFGQIEDMIKGKQLLIVPSGPLTQLPFQVLVTGKPKTVVPASSAGYRDVAWLAREHAITVLPAVSSLQSLRKVAKASGAAETYVGFGNPLLDGDSKNSEDEIAAKLAREKRCGLTSPQRVASRSPPRGGTRAIARSQGILTDVRAIRSQAPLPETADELCEVAHDLGVDPDKHLYMGARATETEVKRLSHAGTLAKYKIVQFATHGAVAGDISRGSEPGLILTPPETATETDDGYLTASEIVSLRLDADWVILSACNTAAGEAEEAEALSGLARAFFYAGARSVLVSHWAVYSDATVKLIGDTVAKWKTDPMIGRPQSGRAEALRRSMLELIDNGQDFEAHPAFWAPFVLVGEGAAATTSDATSAK
jgi:CHAT domain-containing protein/tetratricopeptide (TPR) repeat protein